MFPEPTVTPLNDIPTVSLYSHSTFVPPVTARFAYGSVHWNMLFATYTVPEPLQLNPTSGE